MQRQTDKPVRTWKQNYHPWRKVKIALVGIRAAVLLDFSVQYKVVIAILFLGVAAYIKSLSDFLFILTVTGVMLIAEIMNTVIETICDYINPQHDPKIGLIKDMAAGAAGIAIAIWLVVLAVVVHDVYNMIFR